MITPQICQDYFAIVSGHEGVAENAHQFAVMLEGGWSEVLSRHTVYYIIYIFFCNVSTFFCIFFIFFNIFFTLVVLDERF